MQTHKPEARAKLLDPGVSYWIVQRASCFVFERDRFALILSRLKFAWLREQFTPQIGSTLDDHALVYDLLQKMAGFLCWLSKAGAAVGRWRRPRHQVMTMGLPASWTRLNATTANGFGANSDLLSITENMRHRQALNRGASGLAVPNIVWNLGVRRYLGACAMPQWPDAGYRY